VAEAFEGLAAEWEALETELSPRTPFTSPLWNELWWRHLRRRQPSRDEFFALVVRDNQQLIAVAPMMLTHIPGFGPLRYRHLQFFGATANIIEIRGLVCREEQEGLAIEALGHYFLAHRGGWNSVEWSGVRNAESSDRLLDGGSYVKLDGQIPDYCLRLPSTWQEFRATRKRNIKESLRKCYNSLKRGGYSFIFRVVTLPEEVPAALERFFALHAARASADFVVQHPNYFATAPTRAFLSEYVHKMAERGQLRIFELHIDNHIVATRIGFAFGKELYLYYSGYLPEWAAYSVMTTVVAESLQWAIRNGFTTVNLSSGKDVSKLRWGPDEVIFNEYVQLAPGWPNRLFYRTYRSAVSLREALRKMSWRKGPAR
jgi:CelD/BcsL family acetyltransferase involved in cellulose biosynthesis